MRKMIARLLQNAEFEEILLEERNADGIDVDKKKNTDKIYIALVQIWIFEVVQYST